MIKLENNSQDACAAALKQYGFIAKRRGLLLQPREDKSVTGWLGLNLATWGLPAKLQINPVVGVRHLPLERVLVELAGWPAPVACVSQPLGYMTPQNTFVQWEFSAGDDLAVKAEDLAAAVATHGQPFIEKWAKWKTFSSEISDSGLLLENQRSIVLPLVAALNGNRDAANSLVRIELDRIGDALDAYSRAYREFARKFAESAL